MVQDQAEMGEGLAIHTDPHHTPTFIQSSTSQPQMKQRSRRPKRKDTQVPQSSIPSDNVTDEAVNEEVDDSLVRASTTATSLDAEQDRDIYLVNVQTDEDMFGVNDLDGDEVIVESVDVVKNNTEETRSVVVEVNTVTIDQLVCLLLILLTTAITDVEITLAQALAELKSAKPKADKVVIQEPEHGEQGHPTPICFFTTTITSQVVEEVPRMGRNRVGWKRVPRRKKQRIVYERNLKRAGRKALELESS
ncbi:hypothetical protein Tco_0437756 [Tanacetum coccineum]